MKNIALLLILFSTIASFAQHKKRSPEEKAVYYTREMASELQLDSAAIAAVYPIHLQVSRAFDSLYAANPDKESSRKVAVEIFKNRNKQLKAVLTTIQYLKFDDIQREKMEKRRKEKESAGE